MKNISVGKKILLGFGIVILMTVVILGISTVTSMQRSTDLGLVQKLNSMQFEANQMMENFNLARVEIRTLFTSVETEDEYPIAVDYLDKSLTHLAELEKLSGELDGYMSAEITQMRALFDAVRAGIDTVKDNDARVRENIEAMTREEQQMVDTARLMNNEVTTLTINAGKSDAAAGMERVEHVIVPSVNIMTAVDDVVAMSRSISLEQDMSVVEEVYARLDELAALSAEMRDILQTPEGQAAVDTLVTAGGEFRAAVEALVAVVGESDVTIAESRIVFLELAELVSNNAAGIAEGATNYLNSTVSTSQSVMLILIAIGIAVVALSVFIAIFLGKSITRPLGMMRKVMLQAGVEGDLQFDEEVRQEILREAEAKDELGQSLKAFSSFVGRIRYIAEHLESVAGKDLSSDIELLSEKDTMGNALLVMTENLNQMFETINGISAQVASSSNEISRGAQQLAQGSTEQAATVEEISASVSEINEQMSLSNDTAQNAVTESREIEKAAQEGNDKMAMMIESMQGISNASQAIGRVIKVIDDIAFQTNILALNAAVEAARAGVHGKGFAVVAEEVRNLAGKSAEAAKETNELISTNIERTEQGLIFTQETAESLTQIIEGIRMTNKSLQTVAEQSKLTQNATGQVHDAMDQVAQVVQENSATSEENAAASQELSSQAQILQDIIDEFKLRENRASLPGPDAEQQYLDEPTRY